MAAILFFEGQFEIDTNTDPYCFSDDPSCQEDADEARQSGEDLQGTAGTVALLGLAAGGGLVAAALIMEGDTYEEETLLDRQVVRLGLEPVA